MKSIVIIFFLFLVFPGIHKATTYRTLYSGYWTNNGVWQNGVAPPMSTSDTIIIHNFIEFYSTLSFLQNAYVRIDSTGALCGHDTIHLGDAKMDIYGILENDVFLSCYGRTDVFYNARIIWSQYAILSCGGYLHSNGSINVGPWFNCLAKGYGIEENELPDVNISFNSNTHKLTIEGCQNSLCTIYDMRGSVVFQDEGSNQYECNDLTTGIYILTVKCDEGVIRRKVFVE